MYKDSEPIRSLHSVKKHVANVYASELCLQTKNFPKISKFFFPETLQKIIIIKKYQYFYDNSSEISETSDKLQMHFEKNTYLHPQCCDLIGAESVYIPPIERPYIDNNKRQRWRQGPIHYVYGDAPKWIWDRFGASSAASQCIPMGTCHCSLTLLLTLGVFNSHWLKFHGSVTM